MFGGEPGVNGRVRREFRDGARGAGGGAAKPEGEVEQPRFGPVAAALKRLVSEGGGGACLVRRRHRRAFGGAGDALAGAHQRVKPGAAASCHRVVDGDQPVRDPAFRGLSFADFSAEDRRAGQHAAAGAEDGEGGGERPLAKGGGRVRAGKRRARADQERAVKCGKLKRRRIVIGEPWLGDFGGGLRREGLQNARAIMSAGGAERAFAFKRALGRIALDEEKAERRQTQSPAWEVGASSAAKP